MLKIKCKDMHVDFSYHICRWPGQSQHEWKAGFLGNNSPANRKKIWRGKVLNEEREETREIISHIRTQRDTHKPHNGSAHTTT